MRAIHVEKPESYIPCPKCYDGYLKEDKAFPGVFYCVACWEQFDYRKKKEEVIESSKSVNGKPHRPCEEVTIDCPIAFK